jgi:hypothetical protein
MGCPCFRKAQSSKLKAQGSKLKAQGSKLKTQSKEIFSYLQTPVRNGFKPFRSPNFSLSILQPHGILLNYFRNDDKAPDPHDQAVSSD